MKLWELVQYKSRGTGMQSYKILAFANTEDEARQVAADDMAPDSVWTSWLDKNVACREFLMEDKPKIVGRFANSF